jgi:nucleoside-diphosphate-sugar epimerase
MSVLQYSRALVTGGAGFVGSHIVDNLVRSEAEVTVLDDFSSGKTSNLEQSLKSRRLKVVKGDINDKEVVRATLRDIDVVFHEAAIVSVQRSIQDPEFTNHVNIDGTRNLIELCVDSHIDRFVFASSAAVYGDSQVLPRTETSQPAPISPYASAKLEGETMCKKFYEATGLETVALRYFNIYGVRSTSKAYSGVINAVAQKLVTKERPIVYGNGKQSRDFVNVNDIVQANLLASTSGNSAGRVFNVGTGKQTTVLDLISLESKILLGQNSIEVEFKEARSGDVTQSYADISFITKELNFVPRIGLEEGLQNYLGSTFVSMPVSVSA